MKKNMEDIRTSLTEVLELPIDIAMDLPKIVILGDKIVSISNHRGIIEYTDNLIRINSKIGIIKITGEELEIKNILSEEILIKGEIEKVENMG